MAHRNARTSLGGNNGRLITAIRAVPNGVICLVSALEYYGVVSTPAESVWVAIENKARKPSKVPSFVRLVWMSDLPFKAGRLNVELREGDVPMFSVAKSLVDCFKFRGQLKSHEPGVMPPHNLLLKAAQMSRVRKSDLEEFLDICRMRNVMGPYLALL